MTNGDPQRPGSADETESHDAGETDDLSTRVSDADGQPVAFATDQLETLVHSSSRVGRLPEQFGRYKVLKMLGKGGMGAVYLAEDTQLDRRVAIKVPFVDEGDSSRVVDRFYREAKALAAIVHPNICPIHEVGEVFGVHFIAMTYVEGKSLSAYISPDKPMPIKQALVLVHKLASALHYAHAAGVIHRDLKPANIIINSLKEPVIMDFGLARREGKSDAVATFSGQMMGTPAYMPPEQFAGDAAAMGPGCDIYSLGVILYELLTTQRPFDGDVMAIMSKVAREDPVPPSQHRAEVDAQIDAICLRALAKRPEDRFTSMEEFTSALTDCLKARLKRKSSAETSREPRATSRGGTIQAGLSVEDQAVQESAAAEPVASKPDASKPETSKPSSTLAGEVASAAPPDTATEGGTATGLSPGQGYQLVKQLGTGQYGEVWLGMAPGGIEVAIKKLLFPVGHKATQVELQALELMKRLRHSFLMQVQAYWVMEDQLMIVMELADGSLEDRHAECRRETGQGIPRAELFGYIREAAEAIDFLHQEQVLHRDIKPGNILLIKGHVKVADFGIATAGVLGKDQLTTTSATLGTPLYMGPELWNKQAGPRSDQYSLAVTYVELRLGTDLVFDEQNRLDLSMLPEKEQAVLSKALAPNPRNRYESCQQFSNALDEIVESEHREVEEQHQRELRKVEERRRRELQEAADRRRSRRLQLITGGIILACLPVAWYIWQNWQKLPRDVTAPATITLRAGDDTPFTLPVTRVGEWGDEPFEVTISPDSLPEGVKVIESRTVDGGADLLLMADLQSGSKEVEITLVATAGGNKVERHVSLNLEEAKCEMPFGWDSEGWEFPSDAIKIAVGDKIYYDRIVRFLPNTRTPVELVLIPETDQNECRTFYCMRNKVSNRLFAEFAKDQPNKIDPESQWEKGVPMAQGERWLAANENPDFPVFGVSVSDAHEFAVWFGGQLPDVKQWDTAAGRYDSAKDVEGPFLGSAAGPFAEGEIAINWSASSPLPLPVGTAKKDESHFGCRDMAGNGREWTRSLFDPPGEVVPFDEAEDDTLVLTKGREYSGNKPLTYDDLKRPVPETWMYFTVDSQLSFRCVVEFPLD